MQRPSIFLTNIQLRAGDVNGDNKVNFTDLVILARSYNTLLGQNGFNPDCDLNNDGRIDLTDWSLLNESYNLNGDS